jgi:dUTP pyrophosphatase
MKRASKGEMMSEHHTLRTAGAGVLSADQIRAAIVSDPPLVQDYVSLEEQLQPNGFDLSLAEVSRFASPGVLPASNAGRIAAELVPVSFDAQEMVTLEPGAYQVLINEIVSLPKNIMALARPRSSLNRSGVTIHSAVWDAGYVGRSTVLLHVINPYGFRVQRNARILQMIFFTLSEEVSTGYSGIYQGENLRR